ncbi:hypothetical protein MXB_630 [Myxobolus squamalis]|nr:hypothetical protein MXB_630 [Myxobolus squamalis]
MKDGDIDSILLGIAQQIEGGVPELLHHIFGFLGRKTDFFTGEKHTPIIEEVVKHKDEVAECLEPSTAKSDGGKLLPNKCNGATFENFTWGQTLAEIEIIVPQTDRANQLKSRDIIVEFQKKVFIYINHKKLKVQVKGEDAIIDGDLHHDIKVEGSCWTLEDGKLIRVSLEKIDKMGWWSRLLTSHDEIDTQKIVPVDSKLEDLDGETKSMVEKMMYDQKQKEIRATTPRDGFLKG